MATPTIKPSSELLTAAKALQTDLLNSHAAATAAKANTAFLGNSLRAMNTVVLKLSAQVADEAAATALAAENAAIAAAQTALAAEQAAAGTEKAG